MRLQLTVCAALLCTPLLAYKPAPVRELDFAKPTPDGKFLLVMLRTRDTELTKTYPQPGLYPVDDPGKPVWTLDWSAKWETSVFASGDRLFAGIVAEGQESQNTAGCVFLPAGDAGTGVPGDHRPPIDWSGG